MLTFARASPTLLFMQCRLESNACARQRSEWPNFLGSRPMVEALLSRLRHYCHTVHIDGPSLRVPQG